MNRFQAFSVHPPPSAVVDSGQSLPPLDSSLEIVVQSLWENAPGYRDGTLFNGQLFSVEQIDSGRISGRFVEYRRFLAQCLRPELFEALRIRPLSVSGLLLAEGGVVFGRRSRITSQRPGFWELVPSGGIDPEARRDEGRIDLEHQILAELREEVGMPAFSVAPTEPFCLVDDPVSHVVTVGIALRTGWDAAAIRAVHAAAGTGEYSELAFVAPAAVGGFVATHAGALVEGSVIFLKQRGLL